MKFEKDKFKKNIGFFAIVIAIIIVFILVSMFTNSDELYIDEQELGSEVVKTNKLVITEIASANKGTYADSKGRLFDYIELYNGSDNDINLSSYGLSDRNNDVKWTFPNITMKPKEYKIIFLSGTREEGPYASFKLTSSGGETVALRNRSGKIIDAVDTLPLKSNTVMSRDKDGIWIVTKPTPGFPNTKEGEEEFIKSLTIKQNDLLINEILPNNKGHFKDDFGVYSGYIEIINNSSKTIDLENYSLSNDSYINFKWQFPRMDIKPGQTIAVYTSGRNIHSGGLHTSFKLNNENGAAILTNNEGKVIDTLIYENLANGMAYIRESNGFNIGGSISPGYTNDVQGIKAFQKEHLKYPDDLIINEVMNSNSKYLAQNGGKYYDWIELKNNSKETINLKEYYITTNDDNMTMYNLPDKELKPNEHYIIMASGEEKLSNTKYKHAPFKISSTQSVYLTKNNKIIDSMFVSNVPLGYSMGKKGNYGIYYFSTPSPKAENKEGTEAVSYTPTSDTKSGVYNDTKKLSVKLSGEGTIYYTMDGSAPTKSSKVYSSPISINKTTVLRYMTTKAGKIKSEVVSQSFIMNENHTLPVMSISTAPSSFKSLQSHAWTEGYEVAAYAHYFEEGKDGFQLPCAFQLFGGSTRGHDKKSFEIVFKKKYGQGSLSYQVFEDRESSSYESLVLRTGSQDDQESDSKSGTLIRDILATSLLDEHTNVDVQAYKAIILYINGDYRGVYFIREKIDDNFVSNHYNVDKTKTELLRIDGQVKAGTSANYFNLLSFIRNNSLSSQKNYDKVKEMIDIENIADFWIAETWTANNDIVNVRYFRNPALDDGKWKFIAYDFDYGFYNINRDYIRFSVNPGGMTVIGYSTELLRNLMKSSQFKKTYLERLSYNLKNTWHPDNVNKRIDELYKLLKPEMKRNSKRWGRSYTNWENQFKYLHKFTNERASHLKRHAKSYFGLNDSEYKKYFGGV